MDIPLPPTWSTLLHDCEFLNFGCEFLNFGCDFLDFASFLEDDGTGPLPTGPSSPKSTLVPSKREVGNPPERTPSQPSKSPARVKMRNGRIVWTDDLHIAFTSAVEALGGADKVGCGCDYRGPERLL